MYDYAHVWGFYNQIIFLKKIKKQNHYRYAVQAFEHLCFADETGSDIVEEFINLYRKTAKHYNFKITKIWENAFRKQVNWMLIQDIILFFTCRKKSGELLGVANYVLDHAHQTIFGWLLAYDLSCGENYFLRSLYLYAIQHLAGKSIVIDNVEGIRPDQTA